MEGEGDSPFLWQPPATLTHRHRHRPSSPLLNSSLLIIVLPCLSLLFIVFILVPSMPKIIPHQHAKPNTPQNTKHFLLSKSWDSLNVALVLFAILCGVFAKRKDDIPTTSDDRNHQQQQPQELQNNVNITSNSSTSSVLLQRSKSLLHDQLYVTIPVVSTQQWPEYTQQGIPAPPVTGTFQLRRTVSSEPYVRDTGNDPSLRLFHNFDINKFYLSPTPVSTTLSPPSPPAEECPRDTFHLPTEAELPSPTISPRQKNSPPPPPPVLHNNQQRVFDTFSGKERKTPPPPPPPPPPAIQPLMRSWEEKKNNITQRINATKEIATVLVSLYSNRKSKRKQKHKQHYDDHSPPQNQSNFSRPLVKISVHSTGKPPLPPRTEDRVMKNVKKTPANGILMAPPTPTYKVRAGYVRVRSVQSSKCGAPEMDGRDEEVSASSRVTCPSPDVNLKADTFIARHHNGWRLEKLNFWREKCMDGPD